MKGTSSLERTCKTKKSTSARIAALTTSGDHESSRCNHCDQRCGAKWSR